MRVLLVAICLVLAVSSQGADVLTPKLLIGSWRSEQGVKYYFRADGTWECHAWDMIDGGTWKLRDQQKLELTYIIDKKVTKREIVAIDRVVHETLYVRTAEAREVWLKQPTN
jgi:hypothetical protein